MKLKKKTHYLYFIFFNLSIRFLTLRSTPSSDRAEFKFKLHNVLNAFLKKYSGVWLDFVGWAKNFSPPHHISFNYSILIADMSLNCTEYFIKNGKICSYILKNKTIYKDLCLLSLWKSFKIKKFMLWYLKYFNTVFLYKNIKLHILKIKIFLLIFLLLLTTEKSRNMCVYINWWININTLSCLK